MDNEMKKWHELTPQDMYLLTMAEFKGATLEALKDMHTQINKISRETGGLHKMLDKNHLISAIIGAVGGTIVLLVATLAKLWS